MATTIIQTGDGSHSISIGNGVTYHSTHGAIEESMHVFIKPGLLSAFQQFPTANTISAFEMGFGTGLNALLTMAAALEYQRPVLYHTIEIHPLEESLYTALNYCSILQLPGLQEKFQIMHSCTWDLPVPLNEYFTFKKTRASLEMHQPPANMHVIYFDAFAPEVQPELWTTQIFEKLFVAAATKGLLTTYCSKSIVRKAMAAAGWTVKKIPGPPHKREIVVATKNSERQAASTE